jgi:hypothetical protein
MTNTAVEAPANPPTATLKEIVRQLELRLAAQLQEKLALEGRIYGLIPWVTVTFLGLFAVQAGAPSPLKLPLLGLIVGFLVAALFGLSSTLEIRRWTTAWCYAGRSLSEFAGGEDDVLKASIHRYSKGTTENDGVLKKIQLATIMPPAAIVFGGLSFLFLIDAK